MPEKAEA